MPSQRIILAIGLAILLIISAASIGLDLTSRSDNASVDRALGILAKISDMRPLLRRAESAARAFALSGDQEFAREYREASDTILPALAALIEAVKANPTEKQLIEDTRALVERQIAVNGELIRLRIAGDNAARRRTRRPGGPRGDGCDRRKPRKGGGGRAPAALRADAPNPKPTAMFLLAIDLAGVVLILILATVLTVSTRRSRRELQDSLSATQATNEALEAAVAERTEHLVAAHDELRLSAAVLRSTFHSMAEAVLVIDAKGDILLSNPAAEKMLRYRAGMTVEQLRSLSTAFHADGVTPLPIQDMPAARALRGEAFDAERNRGSPRQRQAAGSSRDQRPAAA